MRENLPDDHTDGQDRRSIWLIYPEAIAIGLIWVGSMAGGIHALVHLLG